jgi:uncharacterized membrane protein
MRQAQFRRGAVPRFGWWFRRTNLWLTPLLTVALALAAFTVTQTLDRANTAGIVSLPRWLDQGSAADARDLLSATAGAIITTLGLVLSITVLTLSLAASQFGQRLLRRYMRDRGTQVCIGVFAATFVFSLLTLLSVTSRPNEPEFVPWLSVWVSTLWALACIGVLIFYINHVAVIIQVNTVVADIATEFHHAIEENHRPPDAPMIFVPAVVPDITLAAPRSGYIQAIDYPAMAKAAMKADAVVQFLFRAGHFVNEGGAVAIAAGEESAREPLQDALEHALRIDIRRTLSQDTEFAIAQIVEIALRAMSPAVNDPNTALTCVDWLGDGLRARAQYGPPNPLHLDRNGRTRVIERTDEFDRMVAAAFDPIRQVATGSPMLTIRLLHTMAAIAPFMPTIADGRTLRKQAELTFEGFSPDAVSGDRADVAAAYQRAITALTRAQSPTESAA